jgi:hypothetical protein
MSILRDLQPSFTSGELSRSLGRRVDLAKFATGLKTAINLFIHPEGGVSNRAGLEFVREVKDSADETIVVPFQFNTEQSYILEFGDGYFRVFRDGGLILSGGSPYEVTTPYSKAHLANLVFTQEADVMYVTHESYAPRKISRVADNNWTLTTVTFAPSITAPSSVSASALSGSGSTTYRYRVSTIADESGEESLPSGSVSTTNDLTVAGNKNRITWAARAGASRYIVYKEDNGVYGYIGGTSGTSFTDENIVADLADTPQTARNPFSGSGNYPRCSTFIDQRLAFASTKNDPQAVFLSQSANYENYGYSSPSKATDAVTFRIKAKQVNEIRSMISLKGLMLMTSGAEWIVTGGSQSDTITPSAIKRDNQGYRGSARVQPIVVGNTVLFAQERGGVIRDFSYSLEADGYTGKDLTVLARHLFRRKSIKAWAYAQAPYSIVWVVLSDGSLCSLTYMKEHEVWGWTRHNSGSNKDAVFEHVAVVDEGDEDVPYFVVKRTVNGSTVRYIERLHTRYFDDITDAFFVDSGLTYDGSASKTIVGLDHLFGESVVALADGNVVRNLTVGNVTGGVGVVLPRAASKVHVGLPVEAALQTLNLDLGQVQGKGTVQGRNKSVAELTLAVEDTRGIFIGNIDGDRDNPKMVEYKQRATENWGEAIQPITDDVAIKPHWSWNKTGSMWVKQFDPLPMTILAIMPDVVVGG